MGRNPKIARASIKNDVEGLGGGTDGHLAIVLGIHEVGDWDFCSVLVSEEFVQVF